MVKIVNMVSVMASVILVSVITFPASVFLSLSALAETPAKVSAEKPTTTKSQSAGYAAGRPAAKKEGRPSGGNVKYSIYYSVPDELSAQDGWAFATPECKTFAGEIQHPKNCEYDRKLDLKNCLSDDTTKVTNAETGEERVVKLRHLFFSTLTACEKDRGLYLTGASSDENSSH